MATDIDDLAKRVQGLPPELFNNVLNEVLTPDPTMTIDKAHKPPVQLQVSQATRKKFAEVYYSRTTFIAEDCDENEEHGRKDWTWFRWLKSISKNHAPFVPKARFVFTTLADQNEQQYPGKYERDIDVGTRALEAALNLEDIFRIFCGWNGGMGGIRVEADFELPVVRGFTTCKLCHCVHIDVEECTVVKPVPWSDIEDPGYGY